MFVDRTLWLRDFFKKIVRVMKMPYSVMFLTINAVECVIDRGFVRQGNENAASLRTVWPAKETKDRPESVHVACL